MPNTDPTEDDSHRVTWSTTQGNLYNLQQSVDLQEWSTVRGFPREALEDSLEHSFEVQGTQLFFRVKELDINAYSEGMVQVRGGGLSAVSSLGEISVGTFQIAPSEVSWSEWKEVRQWALANAYDIYEGEGCTDDHPVHSVSWFDVLKWCNAKSEKEGLTPVYTLGGSTYRTNENGLDGPLPIGWNELANGYRLPSETEWEFSARGGTKSQGYIYSGSNNLDEVGWYDANSSGSVCQLVHTWPIKQKMANELGLYDMSGNVMEWCWDSFEVNGISYRQVRGGSWTTFGFACAVSGRSSGQPGSRGGYGFRLARNSEGVSAPGIISHPQDETVMAPAIATLRIEARGALPFSFQWQQSTDGGISWTDISGANSSSYRTGPTYVSMDGSRYRCIISNEFGNAISTNAILNVTPDEMLLIDGGLLPVTSELGEQNVSSFMIDRFPVTWGEWKIVREHAGALGYDIANSGAGCEDNHPVTNVSWYDVVKWCNLKSEIDGLMPEYTVNGGTYRVGTFTYSNQIKVNRRASNGYRLPSEAEWEFAARGGNRSRGYIYSGSDNLNMVGWYRGNSEGVSCEVHPGSRGTWPVVQKAANELGLYDMSGNVKEWCWDGFSSSWTPYRSVRGGSYAAEAEACAVSYRQSVTVDLENRGNNLGFRLVRNAEH